MNINSLVGQRSAGKPVIGSSLDAEFDCLGRMSSRHRILLVEDNPYVAESMLMLLELLGHEVLVAADGLQGVGLALQENPTAILLDIGLPKMDGYEVCRAIRQEGLRDIPIIAVTGYNRPEDCQKSQDAGFNLHMAKPVDIDELQQFLDTFPGREK